MYRFLLTPRWWGVNLFSVLAIPVCLFMGTWQLSRFEARVESHEEQQRTVSSAAHAAPQPLSRLLPVDERTSGRTAEVSGRYDTARPLLVPDRKLEGERGFYVLSLLRVSPAEPGGHAKALPVVRGWLPGEADPSRVPAPPRGEVRVTGALQASESEGGAGEGTAAGGGLPKGQLGMISAASLVNVVPYDVQDAWITVQHTPASSKLKPVPPVRPDNTGLDMKAFQNLGYTAEWFVFAGFVVFMWFRLFRRDAELAKDAALGIIPGRPESGPGPDSDPEPGPEDAAGRSRSPASTA
ncbi:cytochrome oxidase assembly protein ShyY1 [Streptomyces sp. Amel2xB2]|uniref:SURF1 family protein n=1 Tax=Streptomyces sp. Amel2xB2 TaxID=1305829 RepID=UPI000DBA808C|nr:SURF1 family protein [Streptomyces sp. Amel2xB2]RAJ61805.1 cytochrome oxidase assembly protein ShyY1 [Streptomyces sp. Amel2xB2]